MKRRTAKSPVTRYAPAARLHQLRTLLDGPEGVSIYDVAERFAVNPRTALRYLQALGRADEPLYEETVGKRKVWRLMPTARRQSITLTTAQMVALFLSRRVFDFLAGTGFQEDLDDVFAKLEATLRRRDSAAARNLDRKVFDVNEARHLYEDRLEDVNDIMTALLREDRLRVTHEGVSGGRKTFVLERRTRLLVATRRGSTFRGAARATAASCAPSRSTASAPSSGCAGRPSSTPRRTAPSRSPRARSGSSAAKRRRACACASTRRSRATCNGACGTRRRGSASSRAAASR